MSDTRLPPSERGAGPRSPGSGGRAVSGPGRPAGMARCPGRGQPRAQPCPAHRPCAGVYRAGTALRSRARSSSPAAGALSALRGWGHPGCDLPSKSSTFPNSPSSGVHTPVPSHYGKRPRVLKTKLRWSQQLHPAEHEHVCIHSHPAGPGLDLCAHYVSGELSPGPEWKIRLCCRIYNSFSILYFVC